MWAFLLPILKAMGVGAALGGGTAAVSGGDVEKGALMGAAGGGLGGGLSGLMGGAGGGAAGGSAAGASSGATSATLSDLMKKAIIQEGTHAAVGAATPQYQMSQPGQLPPLSQDDAMAQLTALMQQHQMGGQF